MVLNKTNSTGGGIKRKLSDKSKQGTCQEVQSKQVFSGQFLCYCFALLLVYLT